MLRGNGVTIMVRSKLALLQGPALHSHQSLMRGLAASDLGQSTGCYNKVSVRSIGTRLRPLKSRSLAHHRDGPLDKPKPQPGIVRKNGNLSEPESIPSTWCVGQLVQNQSNEASRTTTHDDTTCKNIFSGRFHVEDPVDYWA